MSIRDGLLRGRRRGRAEADDLTAVPSLHGLSPKGATELAQVTSWSAYKPGETILDARRDEDELVVVAAGSVSVYSEVAGRRLIWSLLGPGRIVGLTPLPPVLAEVACIGALEVGTVVLRPDRKQFQEVLRSHGPVGEFLLSEAHAMAYGIAEVASDLHLSQPLASLAHALARHARAFPGSPIQFTREELGHTCGLSRGQVTEELPKLMSMGFVEYEPGHHGPIHILDVHGLEQI